MERHVFAMKLKKDGKDGFRVKLGQHWEEICSLLDQYGIHNFSLWNAEDLVFGYGESEVLLRSGEEEQESLKKLIQSFSEVGTWISEPGQQMRLMYHDIGIVRSSKELIRHRMFMTRLKPGCEEEYKARHDVLIAKRGAGISEGPDSNFTIWSAGGYIFGYDEIDTSMEREETEAEREATIAWETRQLEIMDWITDDVDWMTGEHHARSRRLAWHA